jgi:pimeloyl-ACP methyl ester carboxylesterase
MEPSEFAQARTLDLPGGVALSYRRAGTGPPVLLVHGWPTSATLWRDVAEPLLAAGHAVVAPDLLGLGRSTAPGPLTLARQAGALEALREHLALERVALVVHDLGGPVALEWATRRPERVAALVVLNTLLFPERLPVVRGLVAAARSPVVGPALTHRWALAALLRAGSARPHGVPARARAEYLAPGRTQAGRDRMRRALADPAPAEAASLRGRIAALRGTPTTIAWARLDVALPPAEERRIAALMPWASRVRVPATSSPRTPRPPSPGSCSRASRVARRAPPRGARPQEAASASRSTGT